MAGLLTISPSLQTLFRCASPFVSNAVEWFNLSRFTKTQLNTQTFAINMSHKFSCT